MDEAKYLLLLNEARNKMWKQDEELSLLRARTQMFDDVMKILYSRTPGEGGMMQAGHPSLEMRITEAIVDYEKRMNAPDPGPTKNEPTKSTPNDTGEN